MPESGRWCRMCSKSQKYETPRKQLHTCYSYSTKKRKNSKRNPFYEVKNMYDQSGHRERLKDRFRKEGLDAFDPVNALELLLFYAIPRIDTKPLARELLNRFGSFPAVLEATEEDLRKVPGIGVNAATFLRLINATGRYYQLRLLDEPMILNSISQCAHYLSQHFYGRRVETVFYLALDAKKRLLSCQKLAEGDLDMAQIPTRKLVDSLLSLDASAVILAHNHPSGMAVPSAEDRIVSEKLAMILESLGIAFVDHLIFSDDDWISMVQSGLFMPKRRGVSP